MESKEKRREYNKKYALLHQDIKNECQRRYYANHREELKENTSYFTDVDIRTICTFETGDLISSGTDFKDEYMDNFHPEISKSEDYDGSVSHEIQKEINDAIENAVDEIDFGEYINRFIEILDDEIKLEAQQ